MTDTIDVVQLQDIDDSVIDLFEITLNNSTTTLYFTEGLDINSQNIYFPNKEGTDLNEYLPLPCRIEGAELRSDGPANRPKFSIANLVNIGRGYQNNSNGDSDETTWKDILEEYSITKPEDICGSTIVHRRTFFKNTSRVGDTPAVPIEFPSRKYLVDRVLGENALTVSYELVAPFDLERVKLPGRIIVGKYCPWKYQGLAIDGDERSGCTYTKGPQRQYFDIDDNAIINILTYSATGTTYYPGDKVKYPTTGFVKIWECIREKPSAETKNPVEGSMYWKRIDICGKTLNSCKVRFQGTGPNEDRSVELPFGGFPGTRKLG